MGLNVRIFEVRVMQCMCRQTGPRFILSPDRFGRWGGGGGGGVRTHVNFKGKIPFTGKKFSSEEDGTHDTASNRTERPTHYQLSYSGPQTRVRFLLWPWIFFPQIESCQFQKLVLQCLSCLTLCGIGSALGLVGPVSVNWVLVREEV